MFGRTIFVKAGGYVDRTHPNDGDAIRATYEAQIWTRANATGIQSDRRFEPLWNFIVGLLGVPPEGQLLPTLDVILTISVDIQIDQEPPAEPWLNERFIILKDSREPAEWSVYSPEEFDDDESVISIKSDIH